ncbi:glycosyltransferase family 4 protein [Bacillus sp. JJ1773]|uniref:glycosyltransferase family 4 protein n=1 Tax=Bacillus sp. JJ1773 TaxID=3122965 RepID=UPI0030001D28
MKVTFFSNFLNHHQLPFCFEMYKVLGDDFKFVATEPIHEERLEMGYEDMSELYPFSLNSYTSQENFLSGVRLGDESDVVIIGSAPDLFIHKRLKGDKLTFRYSERVFKKGKWRILNPRTALSLIKKHTLTKNKKVYMLCASAYTAADLNLVRAYKNKAYKWGYFPEVKEHNIDDLFIKKKNNIIPKLLWVGRLINWKHPEQALKVAYKLKKEGHHFTLDIIGVGILEKKVKEMIGALQLGDIVNLYGSMSPEHIREHMESANIFLFTSDFNEGWGAVLNESMNSGCAVVASHAIGSVPYLLKNNENGLIYENGNEKNLFESVKKLLVTTEFREKLGKNAHRTLVNEWNAKEAAERLLLLSEKLISREPFFFEEGPCSKSGVLSQKYRY